MPQTVAWLKQFGSYAKGGKWEHLEPPRKLDEGKDKPVVDIPTSWKDPVKDLTNTIISKYALKDQIQWNVGTV